MGSDGGSQPLWLFCSPPSLLHTFSSASPFQARLKLGQRWDFLARYMDAVRKSKTAALMCDGEKVEQLRGNLSPLSLLSSEHTLIWHWISIPFQMGFCQYWCSEGSFDFQTRATQKHWSEYSQQIVQHVAVHALRNNSGSNDYRGQIVLSSNSYLLNGNSITFSFALNSCSSLLAKQLTEQFGLISGFSDTLLSIDRERDTSGAESINTWVPLCTTWQQPEAPLLLFSSFVVSN